MVDFSIDGVLLNLAIDFSFIVIAVFNENGNKCMTECIKKIYMGRI